jgi:hypothetical protein
MYKLKKYHKFNRTWLNVNFLWKETTLMIMDYDYMHLGRHFFLQQQKDPRGGTWSNSLK